MIPLEIQLITPEMIIGLGVFVVFFVMIFAVVTLLRSTKKSLRDSKSYVYRYMTIEEPGTNPDLMKLYISNVKKRGSLVKYRLPGQFYGTDYVLQQFEEYFEEVKPLSRHSDKTNSNETLYLSAKIDGDIVYFQLDNYMLSINSLDSPNEFNLKDYILIVSEHGQILRNEDVHKKEKVNSMIFVTNSIKMVYPTESPVKEDNIMDILERSIVSYKDKTIESVIEPIRLWSISKQMGQFRSSSKRIQPYLEDHKNDIDILYPSVDHIDWKGDKIEDVEMSKVMDLVSIGTEELENVAIFGPKGSGKTTLQDYIAIESAKNIENKVYQITAAGAGEFGSLEFQNFLDNEFADAILEEEEKLLATATAAKKGTDMNLDKRKRHIIIIDEAHRLFMRGEGGNPETLLTMMDGTFKKKYNLCWVMVYNAKPEEMLEDLFRSNRNALSIWLSKHNKASAVKLLNYIESKIDSSRHMIDKDQFNLKLKEKKNQLVTSTIWECVKSIRQASILGKKISQIKQDKEVIEMKAPTK